MIEVLEIMRTKLHRVFEILHALMNRLRVPAGNSDLSWMFAVNKEAAGSDSNNSAG